MTPSSDNAREYSRVNSEKFLQELFEKLRIPSLSGDPAHGEDIRRMAKWLAQHMTELGLDNVQVMSTAGHPVVYGEWLGAGPDRPTLLAYGQYDVVPAVLKDGWGTHPFEPVIKDSKIYAGGATDDKGHLMGIPVVMMGYGPDDIGLHAPNEHYSVEMFQRGIETAIVYLEELAQLSRR